MIETERLLIRPLSYEQLLKYLKCDNSLEAELNLTENRRTISAELKEALEKTILPDVADKSKNYLYSTLWTAVSKAENNMVADICMMGEPNAEGEIEIGYGTYAGFRNKGIMTEIVRGVIGWAKSRPGVKSILASTDKSNFASSKVLENNSFLYAGESEMLVHWKLVLKTESIA